VKTVQRVLCGNGTARPRLNCCERIRRDQLNQKPIRISKSNYLLAKSRRYFLRCDMLLP